MNRLPLIAVASIALFAFAARAQESPAKHGGTAQDSLPSLEEQMRVLSEKLDLSAEQQARIKLPMQQLHEATLRIMEDQTLSREQRLTKVRPQRRLADQKIREILSAEQKKKLDAYEAGPHPEMHGTLTGTPKP